MYGSVDSSNHDIGSKKGGRGRATGRAHVELSGVFFRWGFPFYNRALRSTINEINDTSGAGRRATPGRRARSGYERNRQRARDTNRELATLLNVRVDARPRGKGPACSNVRSAVKDVDDAGKLEHVEYEHCDGERTCNQESSRAIKSHQEPSRAIKSHQEPSRAIKSHQGPSRAIKSHSYIRAR